MNDISIFPQSPVFKFHGWLHLLSIIGYSVISESPVSTTTHHHNIYDQLVQVCASYFDLILPVLLTIQDHGSVIATAGGLCSLLQWYLLQFVDCCLLLFSDLGWCLWMWFAKLSDAVRDLVLDVGVEASEGWSLRWRLLSLPFMLKQSRNV